MQKKAESARPANKFVDLIRNWRKMILLKNLKLPDENLFPEIYGFGFLHDLRGIYETEIF